MGQMVSIETRAFITQISDKVRDISVGVGMCYYALSTEANGSEILYRSIDEALVIACAAQAVKCFFADSEAQD